VLVCLGATGDAWRACTACLAAAALPRSYKAPWVREGMVLGVSGARGWNLAVVGGSTAVPVSDAVIQAR